MNRLGIYDDVRHILDEALRSNGGTFTLAERGAAIHWRHRAYTFRKKYAESIYPKPSPYDRLSFPRIEEGSSAVVIKVRTTPGIFTPNTSDYPAETVDPLELEAQALLAKIEKGEI